MPHTALQDWLAHEAISFSIDDPDSLNPVVDRLVAKLDPAVELLGFGEALHGGEEILRLRNRLFQRLVAVHGYAAVAIESSYPRSRVANDYILGRGPTSYDDVRDTGFSHGFGQADANRDLIEWMRQYNADPASRVKLHFYGFDMPAVTAGPASPRQVLTVAIDHLAAIDRAAADAHRQRIEPLLASDADWENPMAWRDPGKSTSLLQSAAALRLETEDLVSALRIRRPECIAKTDPAAFAEALHNAEISRQMLNFYQAMAKSPEYAASLAVRDALMADNLTHIAARERGRGKVLVFAHNAHLQKGRVEVQMGPQLSTWYPAGAHLRHLLGQRYAVIGTAIGASEQNGIAPPEPDTLESHLTTAPGPARIIRTSTLAAAALATIPTRSRCPKNPTYVPLTPQSLHDFDYIAAVDSVTYTRGARPLP